MRSHGFSQGRRVAPALISVTTLLMGVSPALVAQPVEPTEDDRREDASPAAGELIEGSAFSERDVLVAFDKVKTDPNLATERPMRTLQWKTTEQQRRPQPGWLRWIAEFFSFLAQNGRYLFWGVLAVLAGMLLIFLWRLVRAWGITERAPRFEAPSFVRDLDIRPESLPPDIGAAARKLWDAGEHRAALALLYRGLLSRLVHVHGVPIRDSSTEGDCITLANRHLAADDRRIFVTSLVRVWQRAVYGGESVPDESVHALCDGFATALDAQPPQPDAQQAGSVA